MIEYLAADSSVAFILSNDSMKEINLFEEAVL